MYVSFLEPDPSTEWRKGKVGPAGSFAEWEDEVRIRMYPWSCYTTNKEIQKFMTTVNYVPKPERLQRKTNTLLSSDTELDKIRDSRRERFRWGGAWYITSRENGTRLRAGHQEQFGK